MRPELRSRPLARRALLLLALLPVAALVLPCGCGGSGSGRATPEPPGPPHFATPWAALTLGADGTLADLQVPPAVGNLAAAGGEPILEVVTGGVPHLAQAVVFEDGVLTATFDEGRATVRLGVEEVGGTLVFRVLEVTPPDAEALRLRFTLARLRRSIPP